MFLCLLNVLLQMLDGVLTYIGVTTLGHGIDAEGNPILKSVMALIGVIPALVLFKSLAIVAVLKIFLPQVKEKGMFKWTLVLINLVYGFVVISWIQILLNGKL